jgi:hypothetical protein
MYKLTGYVDSKISTGFLIPIYTLDGINYHHKLSDDFSSIIEFNQCNTKDYEIVVNIDSGITKNIGDESIYVLKVKNEVKVCAYSKVAHLLNK